MVREITSSEDLQAFLAANTYVALDFYADWCPPCKAIKPIYEQLAAKHSVPDTFEFAKVNVDHVQDVARDYRITAMPTFLFFKEGKHVAVNGQNMIQGADHVKLGAAAEKVGGLAKKRAEAASL